MSLTSCGSDDKKDADSVAELKTQIVGEWSFNGHFHAFGDPVKRPIEQAIYTFKANGQLYISDGLKITKTKTWEVLIGDKKYVLINDERKVLKTITVKLLSQYMMKPVVILKDIRGRNSLQSMNKRGIQASVCLHVFCVFIVKTALQTNV